MVNGVYGHLEGKSTWSIVKLNIVHFLFWSQSFSALRPFKLCISVVNLTWVACFSDLKILCGFCSQTSMCPS